MALYGIRSGQHQHRPVRGDEDLGEVHARRRRGEARRDTLRSRCAVFVVTFAAAAPAAACSLLFLSLVSFSCREIGVSSFGATKLYSHIYIHTIGIPTRLF